MPGLVKFCQFHEEEIIRELWGKRKPGRCADFGARGRRGSNTAHLLDSGWKCQFIDRNINETLRDFPIKAAKMVVRGFGVYYHGDSNHEIYNATVTPENVNDILWPDLDLISIDVDGPDLEIWKAIKQRPKIVIIETSDGPSNKHAVMDHAKERKYTYYKRSGVNLVFYDEAKLQTPA